MNNISIYIDDVAAVGVQTEGSPSGSSGMLELRIVSRDPLSAGIATTSVTLKAWRAREWDMLRSIAWAIETAQSAGKPQAPEDEAAEEAVAEAALIAALTQ